MSNLLYKSLQLILEYASILTQDEVMRVWLLQGVDRKRRMFPNMLIM